MRNPAPTHLALALISACGSSSSKNVSAFLGTFSCSYNGTYTFTGQSTSTKDNFDETAVITAGTTTDLSISGLVDGTVTGPCTTTLDVSSSTIATFSPTQQECTFLKTDGSTQTNTRTATLTLTDTGATMTMSGTFTGMTSESSAFSGTFSGSWACTTG